MTEQREVARGAGTTLDPDALAELEEERRFLLRSLQDLEREREAGDVDDTDYATLRDDYTVRAADVLRSIEDQREALRERPRRSWRSLVVSSVVVVAVAAGVGMFVATTSGQRLPGQEITGDAPGGDAVPAILVEARAALGEGQFQVAADRYGSVLEQDPDQPEALAYIGWLTALASSEASEGLRGEGIARGKERLRQAIEVDPDYADPHCFLAVIAAEYEDDPATARRQGARCLELDPPMQMRGLVRQFVDGLDEE